MILYGLDILGLGVYGVGVIIGGLFLFVILSKTDILNWIPLYAQRFIVAAGLAGPILESVIALKNGWLDWIPSIMLASGFVVMIIASRVDRDGTWGYVLGFVAACSAGLIYDSLGLVYSLPFEAGAVAAVGLTAAIAGAIAESGQNPPLLNAAPASAPRVSNSPGSTDARSYEIRKGLVCPYCLASNTISPERQSTGSDAAQSGFVCRNCVSRIPPEYADSGKSPLAIVGAVGFRGHGKTMYFASLFHCLNMLAEVWPGFYTFAPDEPSLRIVKDHAEGLKTGYLPEATERNFPTPTIMKFSRIPTLGNRMFVFYDTSGEVFDQLGSLRQQEEGFIAHCPTVMFIVSLDDLEYDTQLHNLMSIYVRGLTELGGSTNSQHLVVVLSKGDRLEPWLRVKSPEVWDYLMSGSLEQLRATKRRGLTDRFSSASYSMNGYFGGMKNVSNQLKDVLRNNLRTAQFVNFAEDRFKSVEYSIVSSTGHEPNGSRLGESLTPKRIMDPLIWLAIKK